jgi:uncharacterized protein
MEPTHNPQENRFELSVEAQLCVLDYRITGGTITFTHTGVPRPLEGRGLAAKLVKFGLEYARAHNKKVASRCSYVDVYLQRHPEYQDLLA